MNFKNIGSRIKEEREKQGLTQAQLATKAGLKDRFTIIRVESGERNLKAWEYHNLLQALGLSTNEFSSTDTSVPTSVLWRNPSQEKASLEKLFLKRVKDFVTLESAIESTFQSKPILPQIPLSPRTHYYDIYRAAESVRVQMALGTEPASCLRKVLEEQYDVKIFSENLSDQGSAAAYRSDSIFAILLNSDELPWRQNFSLAHELFHLLTWTNDLIQDVSKNRELHELNERFAEAFAAGLLMPSDHLRAEFEKHVSESKLSYSSLIALARQFEVSVPALLYRLSYIGAISRSDCDHLLDDSNLKEMNRLDGIKRRENHHTPQFPERFWRLAYQTSSSGKVSRARVAEMLEVSLIDLTDAFAEQGFVETGDVEITITAS